MELKVIEKLTEAFGLKAKTISAPISGYRNKNYFIELNSGPRVNLIVYKSEHGIAKKIKLANTWGNHLHSKGFPARANFQGDDRILVITAGRYNRVDNPRKKYYCSIYNYLEGETIPWGEYGKKQLIELGSKLAEMHKISQDFGKQNQALFPDPALIFEDLLLRMQTYFLRRDVIAALSGKLGIKLVRFQHENQKIRAEITRLVHHPIILRIPLHMDFVRSNVLFSSSEPATISGIIDFEKAMYGSVEFELARTLAFLMVDVPNKTPSQLQKYLIQKGYQQIAPELLPQSLKIITLIEFFLLYDFYKFLLHNPYENLHKNFHFKRTVIFLTELGIINLI